MLSFIQRIVLCRVANFAFLDAGQSPIRLNCSQSIQSQGGFLARACEVRASLSPLFTFPERQDICTLLTTTVDISVGVNNLTRGKMRSLKVELFVNLELCYSFWD